jgi:RNA:NAD 2'-phosphotransferase (TPT1/KptA family)
MDADRILTYYLRHHIKEDADDSGFIKLTTLADIMKTHDPQNALSVDRIIDTVNTDERYRFFLNNACIRANYGHSFPVQLGAITPSVTGLPEVLYFPRHKEKSKKQVENNPRNHQYYFSSPEFALKGKDPTMIEIDTFYPRNLPKEEQKNVVYLTQDVWIFYKKTEKS